MIAAAALDRRHHAGSSMAALRKVQAAFPTKMMAAVRMLFMLLLGCLTPVPTFTLHQQEQYYKSIIRAAPTIAHPCSSSSSSSAPRNPNQLLLLPAPTDGEDLARGLTAWSSEGSSGGSSGGSRGSGDDTQVLPLTLRRSADGSFVLGAESQLVALSGVSPGVSWQISNWQTQLGSARLTFAVFHSEAEFLAAVRSKYSCDVRAMLRSWPPASYVGTGTQLCNVSVPVLGLVSAEGIDEGGRRATDDKTSERSSCAPAEVFLVALTSDAEYDEGFPGPGDVYAATHWVAAGDPWDPVCPHTPYDWGYVRFGVVQCPCNSRQVLTSYLSSTSSEST